MEAAEELAQKIGVTEACQALAIPRSSFYHHKQAAMSEKVSPRCERPKPARALNEEEKQEVLDVLHSPRFRDSSPREVWATLLDEEQRFLCSVRTMYRILAEQEESSERRRGHRRTEYQKPELLATSSNQVWSWDITKLKGPVKWTYFYLYVILDIFSRYVVGWMIAQKESGALAQELIKETCKRQKIEGGQLTLHSDRGSPMKSKTVSQLLMDLGVVKSFSRPSVSDDNPYSEAQFKTVKYHPSFPERFGCIQDARSFAEEFFKWYNHRHHHSGINLLTPYDLHVGRGQEVLDRRQQVLLDAYDAHPERFVGGLPKAGSVPEAAWINPPKGRQKEDCSL